MGLKEECIDMIKLILDDLKEFDGVPEDADYMCYEFEENSGVFVCPDNEDMILDSFCEECEDCLKKDCCKKEYVHTDLNICVMDLVGCLNNGCFSIVFNKKSESKGIFTINNRRQLFDFVMVIKHEVEAHRNRYADYAKKIFELKKYAQEFLNQMQEDYPVFKKVGKSLPIIYESDNYKNGDGEYEWNIGGHFMVKDGIPLIYIYECWRDIDVLKIAVRHEILHYLLFRVNGNYTDDSGFFHYFCDKYDANAYMEMSEAQQKLYNSLTAYPQLVNYVMEGETLKITYEYEHKDVEEIVKDIPWINEPISSVVS